MCRGFSTQSTSRYGVTFIVMQAALVDTFCKRLMQRDVQSCVQVQLLQPQLALSLLLWGQRLGGPSSTLPTPVGSQPIAARLDWWAGAISCLWQNPW